MLVSEMFLLMHLDGRKGKIHRAAIAYKRLGLAGAMILDLGLKGKLSISGSKSRIVDYHASGDPFIDKILVFLHKSKRPLKFKRWLVKISRFYKKSSRNFYQRLENQGILTSGFRTKKYYLIRSEVKHSLIEQIKQGMINDKNLDIELLCLLSLIRVCGFLHVYFKKEYRKYINRRIDGLLHSNYYDPEILKLITKFIQVIRRINDGRNALLGLSY